MSKQTIYAECLLASPKESAARVSQKCAPYVGYKQASQQERTAHMLAKRAAYAEFEATVLDLYERNLLTLSQLNRVASRYRLVKIDSAGSRFLRTSDGKDLCQVCIELVDPAFSLVARGSSEDDEEYWEKELKVWGTIVHTYWNWQAYCNPLSLLPPGEN